MSHESGAAAHDEFRDLPRNPSVRHLKLQAKRRLAAGEFTTLHDAQLAVAREHGMRSWAALKQHIEAAQAGQVEEAEPSHALDQVRWVLQRYATSDGVPGWTPPATSELAEHFTEHFLDLVPPETLATTLVGVAAKLRQELVPVGVEPDRLRARVADLRVEATTEQEPPYRLTGLRIYPDGGTVTDTRVARPPAASLGAVPEAVPGQIDESSAELGLVGVIAAGDWGTAPTPIPWAYAHGWADLDQGVPLRPEHRFPARAITKLITSTAVLRLVERGVFGLDDPVNGRLRSLRLADDAVSVRELLSHTGGVDSPASMWADSVADPVAVLGEVVGCSGPREEFAYSNGGYAVLGQLIADVTESSFAEAVTGLVLEPLGMADSWFPQEPPTPTSTDMASGYRLAQDGTFVPEPLPMFTLQAAGGLWSTGADLVRFGSAWSTLLPRELADEALRPHASRDEAGAEIGLGWLLHYPKQVVGHAGSGPGASASLLVSPDSGRTSVVLTNRLTTVEAVNVKLVRPLA
ncbi:CubicO group peptidase (beta-lactamase class C family) [Catenulispora sp. GAS73]|uniref:serine hydrolase n=1 Tax=Catenulispora sp. GAS73 TaxID=3156269 RepID=UPI003514FC74